MASDLRAEELRTEPRYDIDDTAELLAADGTPHPVTLVNISGGGGQIGLTRPVAEALNLRPADTVHFRIWLPGDAAEEPLQGEASVAYITELEDGENLLLGLVFGTLLDDAREHIDSFVSACLRYAE